LQCGTTGVSGEHEQSLQQPKVGDDMRAGLQHHSAFCTGMSALLKGPVFTGGIGSFPANPQDLLLMID
jgi:hypothetical protein